MVGVPEWSVFVHQIVATSIQFVLISQYWEIFVSFQKQVYSFDKNLLIFRLFQPFLVLRMLKYFDENQFLHNKTSIYLYAVELILVSALSVSIYHYFSLQVSQVGMKMRIACASLIYRKALMLNQKAFLQTSAGQIVNLLSNDVGRLENTIYLNHLFMAPAETIVVMVLIYFSIGWYGIVGAAFLVFSMFLSGMI